MSVSLLNQILNAGLLQFGRFDPGPAPFKLSLGLLPAYPAVLAEIARQAASGADFTAFDRLLCPADAVPVGLALSLQTGVPLVYSAGSDLPPVHDLVGAYDVGHPVLLTVNAWQPEEHSCLIENAKKVGLEVQQVFAIVDTGHQPDLPFKALFTLDEVVHQLNGEGVLPDGQMQAVLSWLN